MRVIRRRLSCFPSILPRLSQSFSSHLRGFQDEAFRWAQENPSAARACLAVPGDVVSTVETSSIQTFEDYWRLRQWNVALGSNEGSEYATRLVSHVLSAPLTLSLLLSKPASLTDTAYRTRRRICCVGARSEATLPHHYWREALFTHSNTSQSILDFVGPELAPAQPPMDLTWLESSLRLQWLHCGYLHEISSKPPWDGFVLFNPGLGHPNLKENWMPTLEYLLDSNKPLLLTAHSAVDADRDQALLESLFSSPVSYRPNPFASRITYEDPLANLTDTQRYVRPNQYVCRLR